MRRTDLERLSRPYGTPVDQPTPGPAEALGVRTPRLEELEAAILSDLSPTAPFGIAWWAPHPGTSRRILIGDQLHACATSAADNLIEAALHSLEFLDYSDQESDLFANSVSFQNGEPVVKAVRRNRPLDDVVLDMGTLHILGLVRAVAGALDCLAGLVVGVAALPTSILRADLARVREMLRKIGLAAGGSGPQATFGTGLEQAIASAGPPGWLDWALDFRNMLVHRGRRLTMSQFVPRLPVLYGANGEPVPRVRVVRQLPRDPARSDVEVFRDPYRSPVLTEDAAETLDGLIRSSHALIDTVARDLHELWMWRRSHPGALLQPREQWKDGPSDNVGAFDGYHPGTLVYQPTQFMGHPVLGQRLRAAALDDSARHQWATFD